VRIRLPALVLVLTGTVAGCGSGGHAGPSPATTTATAGSTSAAAGGPTSSSRASKILAWSEGPGGAAFRQLGKTIEFVAGAAVEGKASACAKVAAAVTAAQAAPPIPDAAASRWYVKALAQYQKGMNECLAGTSAGDPSTLKQEGRAITIGTTDLFHVEAVLKSIG
jgi:hypothetical protein